MTPEDIGDIFQELEDALFAMAIRNMDAHKNWEKDEGFKWTQWQAEQIKGLREYREKVNIMTNKGFDEAKKAVEEFLQEAYEDSVDDAAGLAVKAGKGYIRPGFFGVNSDKMNIILDEAVRSGARMAVLETQSYNFKAISFYKKNGFQIIGFDRYAYSNRGPEEHNMRIEMGKKLQD